MRKAVSLGITGGIGSGKTIVCRIFSILGVPVFRADDEARSIMESDAAIAREVNRIAGRDVYSGNRLDRPLLASLLFSNRTMLDEINELVHPAVREHFYKWAETRPSEYVILEAAVLIESGRLGNMDRIATVVAPLEERIERVMRRNGFTREEVMERIRNQSEDEYKISRSDFVISNSLNDLVIPQVLRIHAEMLEITHNH